MQEELEEMRKAGKRPVSLTRQLLAFSRKELLQPQVLDLTPLSPHRQNVATFIGEHMNL